VRAYVVVARGAGTRSRLLYCIPPAVLAGRGCCVLDPKGALVWDVLAAIASLDEGWWPSLASRVLLVDPSDARASVTVTSVRAQPGSVCRAPSVEQVAPVPTMTGGSDQAVPRHPTMIA